MKRASAEVQVCLLLGILLTVCATAITAVSATAQVTIDGDPADWTGYEVAFTDPAGDHEGGGFDISSVRTFTDHKFLYVLIETHGPQRDYVQVDLEINADSRRFVVTFQPEYGSSAHMGEVTGGPFVPIGEVIGSRSAVGKAVEFKMPLSAFDGAMNVVLTNVRPMGGDCCEHPAWYPVDQIASPEQVSTPEPMAIPVTIRGYSQEWFVAPGEFNMPQEVFLTPAGELLVYAVRGHTLYRVANDGTVTVVANDIWGYLGDVDAEGNLYLHFHPGGRITRISPDGKATLVVESPQIRTACDSGFAVGPDGNMYLALNRCSDKCDLFRITPAGQITQVATGIEQLQALRTTPDGRLLAASCHAAYELSLEDYSLRLLRRIPSSKCVSPGGLAVDDKGNLYLATGARKPGGELYRMDFSRKTVLVAEIPNNGLSGIEWLAETDEIVGGQLRQGGLIAVGSDGTLREIVPGNGIITPMGLAFSPCGELAVANDDGGMMTLVDPAGEVSWFMDYIAFIPPLPFVAFDPDGTLYASEAAPGLFPVRVAIVPPGGMPHTLIRADFPSGLARRADGALFVSETGAGRITQVNPDGSTAVVAKGLNFPQALALDSNDNLYAITGPVGFRADQTVHPAPVFGDSIIRITPEGKVVTVASFPGVIALAVGPEGDLFATVGGYMTVRKGSEVSRVSLNGRVTALASGFGQATGLAFDLAGNLYVSDEHINGILRIKGFPQGTLSGVVTEASGAPVPGARVQVLAVDPIVVGQAVLTDAGGHFSLPAAPRTYSVIVSADGYETTTLEGIQVKANQETRLEISL